MKKRQLKVLVVEADLPLAQQYQVELAGDGHTVSVAHNAEDALEVVSPGLDLLITDLRLPGMSGEMFIHALRAKTEYADLPVLVITAARALPDSLRDQLTTLRRKPFDFDRLADYARDAAGGDRFAN